MTGPGRRCRRCLVDNAPGVLVCVGCGASLRGSPVVPGLSPARSGPGSGLVVGAALLMALGIGLGFWLGRQPPPAPPPIEGQGDDPAPAASRAAPALAAPSAQPDLPPSFAVLEIKHPRYQPFRIPAVVVGTPPRLVAALGSIMGCTEITPVWPDGVEITGVAGASPEHGFVLFAVRSARTLRPLGVGALQLPRAVEIVSFHKGEAPPSAQAVRLTADERGQRQVVFEPEVKAPAVALADDVAVALVMEDGKGLPLDLVGPFLERPVALTLAEFRAQFFGRDPDYLLTEGLAAAAAGRPEDAVRLLLAALAADATLRGRIAAPLEAACVQAARDHLGRGDPGGALDLVQAVLAALHDRPQLLGLAVDASIGTGALSQALAFLRRMPYGEERRQAARRLLDLVHARAAAAVEHGQAAEVLALIEPFLAEFPERGDLQLDAARARAALGQLGEALAAADRALAADPSLLREVAAFKESLTVQGGDTLRIPMDRESRSIVTTLSAGGQSIECLVDTGASMTTVPTALAVGLGILKPGLPTMKVETAGGVVDAQIVNLPQVRLGEFELRSLRALVMDLPGGLAGKGLIGLNLLNRFNFHVDQEAGVLVLERKRSRR